MTDYQKMKEMGKRVGLPLPLISEIYFIGLADALRQGYPRVDLVYMAHVIKYVSVNTIHLKPKWRMLIQR